MERIGGSESRRKENSREQQMSPERNGRKKSGDEEFLSGVPAAAEGGAEFAEDGTEVDVIIIGAGVAGASAAHTLYQHLPEGKRILVLEGRSRVGGRTYTKKMESKEEQRSQQPSVDVDMGANYVSMCHLDFSC